MPNAEAPKKSHRPDDAVVAMAEELHPDFLKRLTEYVADRNAIKEQGGKLTDEQTHDLLVKHGLITEEPKE